MQKKKRERERYEKNEISNQKQLLSFTTKGMQQSFLYQHDEINAYLE